MADRDQDDDPDAAKTTTRAAEDTKKTTLEQSFADESEHRFVLRLYVVGNSQQSRTAIRNVRKLCDEHLPGNVDLEVHDLNQEPWLARDAQIVAAPTLVRELPLPLRRIIGSLSDIERVLVGLEVPSRSAGSHDDE